MMKADSVIALPPWRAGVSHAAIQNAVVPFLQLIRRPKNS
jgi:hypothetical protein